jgi:hypothetical protein
MAKKWWFPLDFKVWRTDSSLRRCSLETRGFWLECLCIMNETETFEVSGTLSELARLLGCESNEVMKCATELKQTNTADVTLGNGDVTLVSRRLKREVSVREQGRLRTQRSRCNASVTAHNKSNSKSKNKKEEEKTLAVAQVTFQNSRKDTDHVIDSSSPTENGSSAPTTDHARLMAHHADRVGRLTDGAKQGALVKQLLNAKYTVEECIACYNHQLTESWRNNQVSWATVIDGTRGISSFVASQKPSEPVRSYNYVQGQPTQREAIEAEQKAIEAMGIQ